MSDASTSTGSESAEDRTDHPTDEAEEQGGQVSEAGGALGDGPSEVGGADATDKSTGSALGNDDRD